jgi:protein-disulfide isomerase
MDRAGWGVLVGCLVLGGSVITASWMLRTPIERAADEIAGLRATIARGVPSIANPAAAPAAPAPPRTRASRRPNPAGRYTVETGDSPRRGTENAEVVLVEFSDFQCPYCARVAPTLEKIEAEYGDRLQVVFKHLPLRMHPKSPAAHAAAEAAHRQGKFWEMHDRIFGNQRELTAEAYESYATELGLDLERFRRDVASAAVTARIEADKSEAERLGVSGTPAFFINGRYLSGARTFEAFQKIIDQELERS